MANEKIAELVIDVGINDKAATSGLRRLSDIVTKFASSGADFKPLNAAIDDMGKAASSAAAKFAELGKAQSGNNGTQAANGYKSLAAAIKQSESDIARFRKEQDAAAQSAIKVATAQKDYQQALALIKGELGLATAGTSKYNNLLLQQISVQSRVAQESARMANETARAAQAQTRAAEQQAKAQRDAARATSDTSSASKSSALSIKDMAAGFSIATVAMSAFSAISRSAIDGLKLDAQLEQNSKTLNTLMGDMTKGNAVMASAIAFGQKYGFTQKQMSDSAAAAAGIFKQTNQTTEKTLEVLGRLASLNSAEGFSGATFAFKELISLDTMSLVERFNLSKTAANEMKAAIAAGADPVKVLDEALMKMGVTSEVLANRMEGTAGSLNRMELASEKTSLALGKLLVAIGAPTLLNNFAAGLDMVATGLTSLSMTAAQQQTQLTQLAIQGQQTYTQYAASVNQANASSGQFSSALNDVGMRLGGVGTPLIALSGALQVLDGNQKALSQTQYTLVQSLVAQGVSYETATTRAMALAQSEANLRNEFTNGAIATQMSAEAKEQLIQRLIMVGGQNEYTRQTVEELTGAFIDSQGAGIEPLTEGLAELEQGIQLNGFAAELFTGATELMTEAQIAANEEALYGVDVSYEQAYALAAKENATVAASIAQQQLALDEQMARQAASDQIGVLYAQEGSLYAMAAAARKAGDDLAYMALMAANAQMARNTTAGRAEMKMDGINPQDQRAVQAAGAQRAQDIVNPAGAAARQRRAEQDAREFSRKQQDILREQEKAAKPKRGGGGGRKAKDSDGDGIPDSKEKKGAKGSSAKAGKPKEAEDAKKLALEAAKDAAETAKALASLNSFIAPSGAAIEAYTSSLAAFIGSLASKSGVINEKLAETTGTFLSVAKDAVGVLKEGTEAFTALKKYTSPPGEAITAFVTDVAFLVNEFATRSKEINVELASSVMLFAEACKASIGIISDGVSAFKDLASFKVVPQEQIALFTLGMRDLFREMSERTKEIDLTLAGASNLFADSTAKNIAVISEGVSAFAALEKFQVVPQVQIALFSLGMRDLMREFIERTKEIEMDGIEAATIFANGVGAQLSLISAGIEGFAKLSTYKPIAVSALETFSRDLTELVRLMIEMSAKFEVEAVAAASVFGTAVSAIISPISTAVDSFSKLSEYKGVASAQIRLIHNDMMLATQLMVQSAAQANTEGVQAASVFASALSTVFGAMSAGIDALDKLRSYETVGSERMNALLGDFSQAVAVTQQLAAMAQGAEAQGDVWQSSLQRFADSIRAGIDAVASLNGLNVNVQASVNASGGGGGGGSAPGGENGGGGGAFSGAGIDGSHAGGLKRVPFSGYVAELHENERVLNKDEARAYNEQERNGGAGINISGLNITLNGTPNMSKREVQDMITTSLRELARDADKKRRSNS